MFNIKKIIKKIICFCLETSQYYKDLFFTCKLIAMEYLKLILVEIVNMLFVFLSVFFKEIICRPLKWLVLLPFRPIIRLYKWFFFERIELVRSGKKEPLLYAIFDNTVLIILAPFRAVRFTIQFIFFVVSEVFMLALTFILQRLNIILFYFKCKKKQSFIYILRTKYLFLTLKLNFLRFLKKKKFCISKKQLNSLLKPTFFLSRKNIAKSKEKVFGLNNIINYILSSNLLLESKNDYSYNCLRYNRFFTKSKFSRNRQLVFSIVQFGLLINIVFIFFLNDLYNEISPDLEYFNVKLYLVCLFQIVFFFKLFQKNNFKVKSVLSPFIGLYRTILFIWKLIK